MPIKEILTKGNNGEKIFEEYCKKQGIALASVKDNRDFISSVHLYSFYRFDPFKLFYRSHLDLFLSTSYWALSDGFEFNHCINNSIFDHYELEFKQLKFKHYSAPTLFDYHMKIMKDRDLLGEKSMGAIDYCSFEEGALYEVKNWERKPSFCLLTENEKESIRDCIGKWKCFIVWVRGKEVKLIRITRQEADLPECKQLDSWIR